MTATADQRQRLYWLLGGLLGFLAAHFIWGPLILLAPGLLSRAFRDSTWKEAILLTLLFGVVFAAIFQSWSWHYGVLAWCGLMVARGLPWLAFGICSRWRYGAGPGLALTSWLLLIGITGNDWEQPIAPLASYPWCLSTLPWLGLVGSAFLIGGISELMFEGEKMHVGIGTGLAFLWAAVSWTLFPAESSVPEVRIALIQTGWAQEEKWREDYAEKGISRLISLTEQAAAEGAELVVWPETAWPYRSMRRRPKDSRKVGKLARRLGVQLLATSMEVEDDRWENSVSQVLPTGAFEQEYVKRRLAPFAEYLPAPQSLRKYHPFNQISYYVAGSQTNIFEFGEKSFGVLVCYESMVPDLTAELREEAVDFVVIVTNDAPLQTESAKEFHLRSAILRAAQFRLPIYQASNNGITAIIDNRGVVVNRTEASFRGAAVMKGTQVLRSSP